MDNPILETLSIHPPRRADSTESGKIRVRGELLGGIMALMTLTGLAIEYIEHYAYDPYLRQHLLIDSSLYVLLFIFSISSVVHAMGRSIQEKSRAITHLDLKLHLSQELAAAPDQAAIAWLLLKFLRDLLPSLSAGAFLVFDWDSNQPQVIAHWEDGIESGRRLNIKAGQACFACAGYQPVSVRPFRVCRLQRIGDNDERVDHEFCLPLVFRGELLAALCFSLHPGSKLTDEEDQMLAAFGPEIVIALDRTNQQKVLSEMVAAEAGQIVRRDLARDLHDTLAQDIGYLRFKIEQLSLPSRRTKAEIQAELNALYRVAEESFDLVRGTLAALQGGQPQRLAGILNEQACSISERNGFKLDFSQSGDPQPVEPFVFRQIFYIFRECMSNIEKHAHARQASVSLSWQPGQLTLGIADDGAGFNPGIALAANHYGLVFIQERISGLGGKLNLETSPGTGTKLVFTIPLKPTPSEKTRVTAMEYLS